MQSYRLKIAISQNILLLAMLEEVCSQISQAELGLTRGRAHLWILWIGGLRCDHHGQSRIGNRWPVFQPSIKAT